jgi:DNA-binding response OmpR family regulator
MARLSYEIAEALVFDPVPANRNTTRSALVEMGFRRIETVSAPDAFARSLYLRSPDLVLCEIQGEDVQICNLISNVRSGAIGYNPFVVVIATSWDKSRALVKRVIDAGADDIILRPYSTGALTARIDTHAERRRGFVITHDYIGPDRRRDPSRVSAVLFEPPNSLAMKTQGYVVAEAVAAQLDTELRSARGYLNAEKIRRDSFQICVLRRMLADGKPGQREYANHLANISVYARAVAKRNADVKLPELAGYCDMVLALAEAITGGDTSAEAIRKLDMATTKLHLCVAPQVPEPELVETVETAVATIREREAKLQAS